MLGDQTLKRGECCARLGCFRTKLYWSKVFTWIKMPKIYRTAPPDPNLFDFILDSGKFDGTGVATDGMGSTPHGVLLRKKSNFWDWGNRRVATVFTMDAKTWIVHIEPNMWDEVLADLVELATEYERCYTMRVEIR